MTALPAGHADEAAEKAMDHPLHLDQPLIGTAAMPPQRLGDQAEVHPPVHPLP